MATLRQTGCCALIQIQAINSDTRSGIKEAISLAKGYSYTAAFCIVIEGEEGQLAEVLKDMGFDCVKRFTRRYNHDRTHKLSMYFLDLMQDGDDKQSATK